MKSGLKNGYYWLTGICLVMLASGVWADSLEAQRDRYQQIKQAWDTRQMSVVAQLMPTLRDYPLYPYLEYRQLLQQLDQTTPQEISDFIGRYPALPTVSTLSANFVNELARRKDWSGLLAFAPRPPEQIVARCNWYYASWAVGHQQEAWEGAKNLWLRDHELPAACDALIVAWQSAGQQTPVITLERIRLAMMKGNSTLMNSLIHQLPADYQTMITALPILQKDPATVQSFAHNAGPTSFTRQITLLAFNRLARRNSEEARELIPLLVRLQQMDAGQQQEMQERVAWTLLKKEVTADQARWRDDVIMRSASTALTEQRIRLALSNNQRRDLQIWLARLPADAKQKEEWQYWLADVLQEQGHKEEAEKRLHSLMQGRGFYAVAAAQRLGKRWTPRLENAPAPDSSVDYGPELARIRELMYWQVDNLARREWVHLLHGKSGVQQQMLARYALEQQWWDLAVQATITGKLWAQLTERFPLAWQDVFIRFTRDKQIAQSYAMAIARQESAWNPRARSPVGAAGLMQVMPATALQVVQKYSLPGYVNQNQLFDPQTNIQIGTQYLEYVFQQFGQNRIFSTAAYNAGPGRVKRWLNRSAGQLNALAFIETIPYAETRNYVKNVLTYDVIYRYFLHQPGQLLTESEWRQHY